MAHYVFCDVTYGARGWEHHLEMPAFCSVVRSHWVSGTQISADVRKELGAALGHNQKQPLELALSAPKHSRAARNPDCLQTFTPVAGHITETNTSCSLAVKGDRSDITQGVVRSRHRAPARSPSSEWSCRARLSQDSPAPCTFCHGKEDGGCHWPCQCRRQNSSALTVLAKPPLLLYTRNAALSSAKLTINVPPPILAVAPGACWGNSCGDRSSRLARRLCLGGFCRGAAQ